MISWDFFSVANNLGDSVAFNLESNIAPRNRDLFVGGHRDTLGASGPGDRIGPNIHVDDSPRLVCRHVDYQRRNATTADRQGVPWARHVHCDTAKRTARPGECHERATSQAVWLLEHVGV